MAVGLGARLLPKQWLAPLTAKGKVGRRAAAVAALAAGKSTIVKIEHVVPWSELAKALNSDQFQRLVWGREKPSKQPTAATAAPALPIASTGINSRPQHTIKRREVGAPPAARKSLAAGSSPASSPRPVNPFAAATRATPKPGEWAFHLFGVEPPPERAITNDPNAAANEAIESAHDAIAAARNGQKKSLAQAADWADAHARSAQAAAKLQEAMHADDKRLLAEAKATAKKTGSESDILRAQATEAWLVRPGKKAIAGAQKNARQATDAATFVGRLAARGPIAKSPADLALFGPEARPTEYHAAQAGFGDCWLLTTAGAAAKANPDAIKRLFKANDDGSVSVTLHNPDMKLDPATGRVMTHTYTFRESDLPHKGANRREPRFSEKIERPPEESGALSAVMPGVGTLSKKTLQPWVAYLELAAKRLFEDHPSHMDADNGVPKSDFAGGNADLGTRVLFGKRHRLGNIPAALSEEELVSRLRTAYKDPIYVATKADKNPIGWPQGLGPSHAYQVAHVTTRDGKNSVTLRNPHYPGLSSTTTITLAEFQKHVGYFSNLKDAVA